MKYRATRTFGKFREGQVYEIGRLRLEERSAVRTGLLVAAEGWCAPSETLYAMDSLVLLPNLVTERGGVRLPVPENVEAAVEAAPQPAKRARKPRKAVTQPDTLESLAEATSEALDGLRGQ